MDNNALFKIEYGLYVLTTKEEGKNNGCIINTVMQATAEPCQVIVALNKQNYSCEVLQRTKKFNLSILSENANFEIFKNFGYQSGKNIDKFANFLDVKESTNGIYYITKNSNAYLSGEVEQVVDLGSHVLFVAKIVESVVLSDEPTVTYNFYQKNIKPKTQITTKKGWRCKICGYIYEGEILPPDFICPICKHGAIDFEKL